MSIWSQLYVFVKPLDAVRLRRIDDKIARGHQQFNVLSKLIQDRETRSTSCRMTCPGETAALSYEEVMAKKAELTERHQKLSDKRRPIDRRLREAGVSSVATPHGMAMQ